jgi:hypothetical protein
LAENNKLKLWPLDECPRPKSGKWRLNLHGHHFGRKIIGSDPKKELKGHDLENQDAR